MTATRLATLPAMLLLLVGACSGETPGGPGGGPGGEPENPFGDDPIPGEDVCAELLVNVNGVTPTVSLLIDQSSSMDSPFGDTDRWDAVYETLMQSGGVVDRLASGVRFGLALYTNSGGTCPAITSMPPALNNFAAIDSIYRPSNPTGDTPTGASITVTAAQLAAVSDPGPKIIILGTDGEPDTCAQPNPNEGQGESIAAAQQAFASGIRTFIISVGDDVGASHLQDMANAGVGLAVNGTENAPFYRALDPGELIDAFNQIIGGVTGCVFTLQGEVDPSREGSGRVALDGKELAVGEDWRLLDSRTFEILGDACDKIQDGDQHDVAAFFPCGSIIVE